MQQFLDAINNIRRCTDDIFIWGPTEKEQKAGLDQVLQIPRANGQKLSKIKCQFQKKELLNLQKIL